MFSTVIQKHVKERLNSYNAFVYKRHPVRRIAKVCVSTQLTKFVREWVKIAKLPHSLVAMLCYRAVTDCTLLIRDAPNFKLKLT